MLDHSITEQRLPRSRAGRVITAAILVASLPSVFQLGSLAVRPAAGAVMFADLLTETARLQHASAAGGFNDDSFGYAVSMSGDTALVGGHRIGGQNRGRAMIFERNAGGPDMWGQVKVLTALDGDPADQFGAGVVIDGDTAVVGAPSWESATGWTTTPGDPKINKGKVYIFERDAGSGWGLVQEIAGPVADGALFGNHVDISGDTMAVSARKDFGGGSVWLFRRSVGSNQWAFIKKITPPSSTQFGVDVAISGDTLLVGQLTNTRVHFYERNWGGADNWGVKQIVGGGVRYGFSVDIDGDTAVVGAIGISTGTLTNNGAAFVYGRNQGGPGNWVLLQELLASDRISGAQLGSSVAVAGDIVVAGAFSDDRERINAGSAYVFIRNEGGSNNWGEKYKLIPDPPGSTQFIFGWSGAASGNRVIIGAPYNPALLPTVQPGGFAYVYDVASPAAQIRFFVGPP